MKLPRDLNGIDLVRLLGRHGFQVVRQTGSHVQLKHSASGTLITVPSHTPLKVGTLATILRDFEEITGLAREDLFR